MKKVIGVCLSALCLAALSGCGGDIEADLVFVNGSDAVIVEVVVDFQDQGGGSRNADSSPQAQGILDLASTRSQRVSAERRGP